VQELALGLITLVGISFSLKQKKNCKIIFRLKSSSKLYLFVLGLKGIFKVFYLFFAFFFEFIQSVSLFHLRKKKYIDICPKMLITIHRTSYLHQKTLLSCYLRFMIRTALHFFNTQFTRNVLNIWQGWCAYGHRTMLYIYYAAQIKFILSNYCQPPRTLTGCRVLLLPLHSFPSGLTSVLRRGTWLTWGRRLLQRMENIPHKITEEHPAKN